MFFLCSIFSDGARGIVPDYAPIPYKLELKLQKRGKSKEVGRKILAKQAKHQNHRQHDWAYKAHQSPPYLVQQAVQTVLIIH